MKKVLLILSYLIIIGGMGFGIWHFYNENKNQIEQNAMLTQQNAQVQAQLNAIGAMTTVYEVSSKVYAGKPILDTDLMAVSVPVSTIFDSSVTDASQLIGKYYKVDINPGTILSTDMLMDVVDDIPMKYTRTLNFTTMPVGMVAGDYMDLRFMMANGEEITVLSHKRVDAIYNTTTVLIQVSEEENALINALIHDLGVYPEACIAYMTKYLEPGIAQQTVAYYPVQHDMENYIKFSPNFVDVTRCINPTMRDHIDEMLLWLSDSDNASISQSYLNNLSAQYSAQLSAHNTWVQDHTNDEGELVVEGNYDFSEQVTFEDQVGDAMDSLDQSIEDLEGIY